MKKIASLLVVVELMLVTALISFAQTKTDDGALLKV